MLNVRHGEIKKNVYQQKAHRDYYVKKSKGLVYWWCFPLIIIFAIYLIFYSPAFTLTNIKIEKVVDNNLIKIQDLEKEINALLKQKKLFLFPQRNFFILQAQDLIKKLEDNPKIEEAEVEKRGAHTLLIKIKEVKPKAKLIILGDGDLYLLNKEATIFTNFTTSSMDISQLPLIYDKTYSSLKNPKYLDALKSALKLIDNPILARNFIKITFFILTEEKGIFEIRALSQDNCAFIFTSSLDFNIQLTNLGLILKDIKEKMGESKFSQLEYVDLRYGDVDLKVKGRIFYKLKETSTPATSL